MKRLLTFAAAIATVLTVATAPAAVADDDGGGSRELRRAVSAPNILRHLQAFERHADANGGNRVGGSPGYEASAEYVSAQLRAAGYRVTSNEFEFLYNADATPAGLASPSAPPAGWVDGVDFSSMTFSPNGDVTAPVTAVDLVLPPPPGAGNNNTSGCEAADFAGFPAGSIALVQRGTCPFGQKAANAAAAGAAAVIVFNEGQVGRTAAIAGTLGAPVTHAAPVLGTTFAIGETLAGAVRNGPTGTTARVRVDREFENRTTRNIIAELPGRNGRDDDDDDDGDDGDDDDRRAPAPDDVLVVGAHLDSVPRGPGVQDNGSGSATILELARQMRRLDVEPRNTVRFMWFGAEEFGLLGSEAYVAGLPPAELARIKAMINFDMIASPNFVRFRYDGDNSGFPAAPPAVADGPPGSGEIERLFADYFTSQRLPSSETPFNGRSDYGPFIARGIPAGGLFTGAEGIKSAEEARVYGGTAGIAYDPCYHLACDRFANINRVALEQNADAAAHVALALARRNFTRSPLVDPAPAPVATVPAPGGGGGLHDHGHDEVELS